MGERIIVIGGGAGGLELVVRLARKFKRDEDVEVFLVDRNPTHVWKPLFHEVATGSMNSSQDETSYRMLARKYRFRFALGEAVGIDLEQRRVALAAVLDENGAEMMPARSLAFDTLVVSVGAYSNDFGIEGVRQYSRQLDSREQAEAFHRVFAARLHRVNALEEPDATLDVVIVGAGATGVELAADMHNVVQRLGEFGFEHLSRERLRVTLFEAAPRVLPRLPERIGRSVTEELGRIGVTVRIDSQVARVLPDAVETADGETVPADISVWAAGVKAPAWLAGCGFDVDRLGRIAVNPDLSVQGHPGVYALGDCAGCTRADGTPVPARAQAAHQMASVAYRNILRRRRGKAPKPFVYRDFGSLISLSSFSTVGNLMGNLMRGTVFVEGWAARLVYLSLYRMHQAAVHGRFSTLLIMLGDRIYKATRAEVKLH